MRFDANLDHPYVFVDGTTAGPAFQTASSKPKKQSRVAAALEELVSLKQEEVIPPIGEEDVLIDLTDIPSPSPPATPIPDDFAADNWVGDNDGVEFQDSGVIDLTLNDTIDLTKDTVILLDDDDVSVAPSLRQATESYASSVPDREISVQQGDSDNDSLFDGPGLEDEGQKHGENDMLWHLAPNSLQSNTQPIQPVQRTVPPTKPSLHTLKKGRKRALDFDEDASNALPGHATDSPRKKRVAANGAFVPSLLTAERGKVVERGRNGEYRVFDAHSSAGSALAAKAMQRNEAGDTGSTTAQQGVALPGYNTYRQPVIKPEDLEDYEDEEELITVSNE